MALFDAAGAALAETVSRLVYCNPFLPERLDLERAALGPEYVAQAGMEETLHMRPGEPATIATNVERLLERLRSLVDPARERLAGGANASAGERRLYEDVALFLLYHEYHLPFRAWIGAALEGKAEKRVAFYGEFEERARFLLAIPDVALPHADPPAHLFAFFFQLNRAFVNIYQFIVGGSLATAKLRGSIWQSIFTHDLGRFRRVLYDRLGDISTLITGPSGTGKELVARAVGMSRYIPFDPRARTFEDDFVASFHPLNLSAMSPTLIESELFGHRRGAFTGAVEDRVGWFETCSPRGSVFLDEVGDLDASIQVKLLRVLQSRSFQRLGETAGRTFDGKLIAATNRDLGAAMRDGTVRQDFYYRLCSDLITTPCLKDQLAGSAEELENLIDHVARRLAGVEAEALTAEVMHWVERELGLDYDWPGNFRELEQCVRNVLIRREYRPAPRAAGEAPGFLAAAAAGLLTADELLKEYCRLVYGKTKSFSETARRLNLDRRTVRAKVGGDGEGED